MINICTLSDKNFLLKGLALYQSLHNICESNFMIHYLCLDSETYNILEKLNFYNIRLYSLEKIESIDSKLTECRNNPSSEYAANKEELQEALY